MIQASGWSADREDQLGQFWRPAGVNLSGSEKKRNRSSNSNRLPSDYRMSTLMESMTLEESFQVV